YKCKFAYVVGCDFYYSRETYITSCDFTNCPKAIVVKNAAEVRIDKANIKLCEYGIYADGDLAGTPGLSNGYHAGLYLMNSFVLANTNYPVYCTYLDYIVLMNNQIDYNDYP